MYVHRVLVPSTCTHAASCFANTDYLVPVPGTWYLYWSTSYHATRHSSSFGDDLPYYATVLLPVVLTRTNANCTATRYLYQCFFFYFVLYSCTPVPDTCSRTYKRLLYASFSKKSIKYIIIAQSTLQSCLVKQPFS